MSICCSRRGGRHDERRLSHRCVAACRAWRSPAATTSNDRAFQGWVEAELIFVGRPTSRAASRRLNVREGDQVEQGDLLFTVDDDLQQADLAVQKAAVTNAQQAFDRAKELLKTAAGTQKTYDDAEAALRQAKANLDSSQTRLARRDALQPGRRHHPAGLLPRRRDGAGRQAGRGAAAAGQSQAALLRAGGDCCRRSNTARPSTVSCDGCEKGLDRQGELHRAQRRIHAAGDLQPGGARQARVPDRGAARTARRNSASASR